MEFKEAIEQTIRKYNDQTSKKDSTISCGFCNYAAFMDTKCTYCLVNRDCNEIIGHIYPRNRLQRLCTYKSKSNDAIVWRIRGRRKWRALNRCRDIWARYQWRG